MEKDAGGAYTEYVFGLTEKPEGEYNRTSWTDTWVSFEGRHFAHFSNGDTYFVHADRIGTTNIVTDWNTGTVVQDELHYPWGQVWTSAGSSIEERFAGLQHRDSESNLDPTQYRMFSSDDGRWTTPDPADQMSANPLNPQSWNRYAYALNNSTNFADPYGLISWRQVGWGAAQFGLGVGAIGLSVAAGVTNIMGGLTAPSNQYNTAAANAASAVATIANPFGLVGTLASGGNLGVGQATAAIGDLMTAGADISSFSSSNYYQQVNTAIDIGETGNQVVETVSMYAIGEYDDSSPFGGAEPL